MMRLRNRRRVTLVLREHDVLAWAEAAGVSSPPVAAQATRPATDVAGLERALDEALANLRRQLAGAPRLMVRVLIGSHAVRTRRVDGIPRTLGRRALNDYVREGLPRLLAVRPEDVSVSVAREGDGVLVAAYDLHALSALYECATRLGFQVDAVVPELVAAASHVMDGIVEARDGRWLGRIDVAGGAIARMGTCRVTEPVSTGSARADEPRDPARVVSRRQRHRLAALAAPRPQATAIPISRSRARFAASAVVIAALLLVAAGPLRAVREREAGRRALAALVSEHAGLLDRQRELLALRETMTEASRLANSRPSVLGTVATFAQLLPDEMSLLHLELDTLGGSVVVLAPRAGAALARFDGAAGIASPTFSGPITRETVLGRPLDRATIAFRFPHTGTAP